MLNENLYIHEHSLTLNTSTLKMEQAHAAEATSILIHSHMAQEHCITSNLEKARNIKDRHWPDINTDEISLNFQVIWQGWKT
jgi:hypothetical protein